jgi:hypothetical protein
VSEHVRGLIIDDTLGDIGTGHVRHVRIASIWSIYAEQVDAGFGPASRALASAADPLQDVANPQQSAWENPDLFSRNARHFPRQPAMATLTYSNAGYRNG